MVENNVLSGNRIQIKLHQGRCSLRINLRITLFLIFLNDIVTEIGSSIRIFADNTSVFIIVDNSDVAAEILNADFDKIVKCTEAWLEKFISLKTESLLIGKSINLYVLP